MLSVFAAAFLCSGFLHIFLDYNMEFFNVFWVNHFTQTLMSVLVMLWAISVYKRITDRRQRRILLAVSAFMILFFTLQTCKYRLFTGLVDECRYLWYGYYVPQIAIPALLLCEACAVQRPPKEHLPGPCRLVVGFGVALAALILTNDIHQLAFFFTGTVKDDDHYSYGPVFYLYCAYYVVILAVSFFILIKKARRVSSGRSAFLPVIPIFVYLILSAIDILGKTPRIDGIRIWNVGEEYAFAITAFIETCIQIGLIPANSRYDELFRLAPLNAQIMNEKGEVVYTSGKRSQKAADKGNIKEYRHEITGGFVRWEADISGLVKRSQELEELYEQLSSRQEYLKQQNKLLEQQARLTAQNDLYDRIFQTVRPQLLKIDTLLGEKAGEDQRVSPQVAVLAAYVKRRSNMELSITDGLLSSDELVMALYETMDNVRLCGINAESTGIGSGDYPARMIIGLYEAVRIVLENSLQELESIMITLSAGTKMLSLRMMIRGRVLSEETLKNVLLSGMDFSEAGGMKLTTEKQEDEILLSLVCMEGNERFKKAETIISDSSGKEEVR